MTHWKTVLCVKYWIGFFTVFITPSLLLDAKDQFTHKISIIHEDWGKASKEEIRAVLTSTADSLLDQVEIQPKAILVGRSSNGPIVLFKRGKNGEFFVNLNTQDRLWSQYAFQFAHEIGHIICGFKEGHKGNLWFEETICEVASLFALQSMSKKWIDFPPHPNWKSYAKEFNKYALNRMKKNSFSDKGKFLEWFRINKHSLTINPTDRSKNCKIATILLPLFKNNSHSWSSCQHLNDRKNLEEKNFDQYLLEWKQNCPLQEQKKFVKKISNLFGIQFSE